LFKQRLKEAATEVSELLLQERGLLRHVVVADDLLLTSDTQVLSDDTLRVSRCPGVDALGLSGTPVLHLGPLLRHALLHGADALDTTSAGGTAIGSWSRRSRTSLPKQSGSARIWLLIEDGRQVAHAAEVAAQVQHGQPADGRGVG
jgi:hypothetical protein